MSNIFCVNKSGSAVPVYSNTNKSSKIGTINNREAFGYNRDWGGDGVYCNIVFRSSTGAVKTGYLVDPPNGTLMPCSEYPYGSVTIGGTTYKTFYMRRDRNIYTVKGNLWGTAKAGKLVACLTGLAGDAHPEWKGINYAQNANGVWIKVEGDGKTYGYVDAGLSIASGYNSIPMYGSW